MTDYNASRRFIKARKASLVGNLTGRSKQIQGVFLHSTRSGVKDNDDGPGTENWATRSSNASSFWDFLIFGTGQQVKSTYWEKDEQPLWCAGYGEDGTWSAQDNFIHIEISQGTIDSEFTKESIESLCQFVAEQANIYKFPVRRIGHLDQYSQFRPWGIANHQDSDNGKKLGKSDVGPLFPWSQFLSRTTELLTEGQAMSPAERKEFDELKEHVAQLRKQAWGEGKNGGPPPMRDKDNPYADATMYDVAKSAGKGTFRVSGTLRLE